MRISPITQPYFNKNYRITSKKNFSKTQTYDEYFATLMLAKASKARDNFKADILPRSTAIAKETNTVINNADALYHLFSEQEVSNSNQLECTTVRNGFKKTTFIRVYDDGKITKEIKVIPKKYIRVKKYNSETNSFNAYDYNYQTGISRYFEGFEENINQKNQGIKAGAVYTFQNNTLLKYEKGVCYYDDKEKSYSIGECYKPDYQEGILKYKVNVFKKAGMRSEKCDFKAFKKLTDINVD